MSLLTGEILKVYPEEEGLSIARVRVGGAHFHVVIQLVPDAQAGDFILIESGVAIAKVEKSKFKEA